MKYYIKKIGKEEYFLRSGEGLTKNKKDAFLYSREEALFETDFNKTIEMIPYRNYKLLILGHARHGKDTLAEIICDNSDLKFAGSSMTSCEIFLFDILNKKYNLSYSSVKEAWEDRVNHRDKWYNEICAYNSEDKLRLVKDILKIADIYVGLRNHEEVEQAIKEKSFDHIIGIYDYRKPLESKQSNTADVLKYSDFIITNNGTIDDLKEKVIKLILSIII